MERTVFRFVPVPNEEDTYRIVLKDRLSRCERFLSASDDCSIDSVGFVNQDIGGLQRWVFKKVDPDEPSTPSPSPLPPTPTPLPPQSTAIPAPSIAGTWLKTGVPYFIGLRGPRECQNDSKSGRGSGSFLPLLRMSLWGFMNQHGVESRWFMDRWKRRRAPDFGTH